jgi:hypothetical protein
MSDPDASILDRANAIREELRGNAQDIERLFSTQTFAAPAPSYEVPGFSMLAAARAALVAELAGLEQTARQATTTCGNPAPRVADFVGALYRPEQGLAPGEEWIEIRIRVPKGI